MHASPMCGGVVQVATKGPKSFFGEMALMYNAPRAATVTSVSEATVWVVDRFTFRSVTHSDCQSLTQSQSV